MSELVDSHIEYFMLQIAINVRSYFGEWKIIYYIKSMGYLIASAGMKFDMKNLIFEELK